MRVGISTFLTLLMTIRLGDIRVMKYVRITQASKRK